MTMKKAVTSRASAFQRRGSGGASAFMCCDVDIGVSLSKSPPGEDGLDKTSQQGRRFGQALGTPSQRALAPFELRPLDGVRGERDRQLVRACGARTVAGAAE